jgi:hypothetical protein
MTSTENKNNNGDKSDATEHDEVTAGHSAANDAASITQDETLPEIFPTDVE